MNKRIYLIVVLALIMSLLSVYSPGRVPIAKADAEQTYIVLYKGLSVPKNAIEVVKNAGGTVAYQYNPIGVVIARSSNANFREALLLDKQIENVSSTTGFGIQFTDQIQPIDISLLASGSSWGDPLSSLQWDMVQIHVPEAYEVNSGSPDVLVGDIDSGIDYTHPDLAANVDFAHSASCLGGVPDQAPSSWMDGNGHGTHTAGTIAAAENGIGIVGVAPNVKIAAIKAADANGYLFPEAIVCAFMWAGYNHMQVTNNSYFVDPWVFNCRNDPDQRAIWKAEQRAIQYAMKQGVVVVAAMGNFNMDLSKTNIDPFSPDTEANPTPREVTNACVQIPAEIPGVIGVSADGFFMQKAFYSNYGVGVTQLTAPGGDPLQDPNDGTYGFVLSTYPGDSYALFAGTSMATPHVTGVAALIMSQFGPRPPGAVQAMLNQTADPIPCPANPFDPFGDGTDLAICKGGVYNGFFGNGQVNAYNAVIHAP